MTSMPLCIRNMKLELQLHAFMHIGHKGIQTLASFLFCPSSLYAKLVLKITPSHLMKLYINLMCPSSLHAKLVLNISTSHLVESYIKVMFSPCDLCVPSWWPVRERALVLPQLLCPDGRNTRSSQVHDFVRSFFFFLPFFLPFSRHSQQQQQLPFLSASLSSKQTINQSCT